MRLLSNILASILDAAKLRRLPETGAGGLRIETAPIASVGNEGRYILNITKGGPTTVTGRNPGYAVGQNVQVVTQDGSPVAIVGHEMLKAQFHPTGKAIEEVEEIYATYGGVYEAPALNFWLRSHRGLFYMDLEAVVSEVLATDQFTLSGSHFNGNMLQSIIFGQTDNQFGVLVQKPPAFGTTFSVAYVFQINRKEGSDAAPLGGTVTVNGVSYSRLAVSLVGYYDLSELSLDTGISVNSTISLTARQLAWIHHMSNSETRTFSSFNQPYSYFVVTTEKVFFDQSIEVIDFELQSSTSMHAYNVRVDFEHLYGMSGTVPYILADPAYYALFRLHWWIDPKGRPVFIYRINNLHTLQISPWTKRKVGIVPNVILQDAGYQAFMSEALDFTAPPLLTVRLDRATGDGGLIAFLLARTCDTAISVTKEKQQTFGKFVTFTVDAQLFAHLWIHWVSHSVDDEIQPYHVSNQEAWNTDVYEVESLAFGTFGLGSLASNPSMTQAPGSGGQEVVDRDLYEQTGTLKALLRPFLFGSQWSGTSSPTTSTLLLQLSWMTREVLHRTTQNQDIFHSIEYGSADLTAAVTSHVNIAASAALNGPFVIDGRSHRGSEEGGDVAVVASIYPLFWDPNSLPAVKTALWSYGEDEHSTVLRDVSGWDGRGDFDYDRPSNALNSQYVLLEYPIPTSPRQVSTLDGSSVVTLPDELGADLIGEVPVVLLAPDRLYDCRDAVLKFRQPLDPASLLSKPKPLVDVSALYNLNVLWGDFGKRSVHTVGSRTKRD